MRARFGNAHGALTRAAPAADAGADHRPLYHPGSARTSRQNPPTRHGEAPARKCRPLDALERRVVPPQSVMRTREVAGASPPSGMTTRPSVSGASPGERARAPFLVDLVGHPAFDLGLRALGGDVLWKSIGARRSSHLVRHRARARWSRPRPADRRRRPTRSSWASSRKFAWHRSRPSLAGSPVMKVETDGELRARCCAFSAVAEQAWP